MTPSNQSVEQQLESHKKAILSVLKKDGNMLSVILADCPEYASKKEVILSSIKNNPNAIELASDDLKNDLNFLFDACRTNPYVFRNLEDGARKNKEFIKSLLNESLLIYGDLDPEEQGDFEIAKLALNKGVCSADIINTPLINNREVLFLIAERASEWFISVSNNGSLVNDKEIMSVVLKNNHSASFWWLGEQLKNDVDFLVAEIIKRPELIKDIEWKNYSDASPIVSAYIQACPQYPSEFIREHDEFAFLPALLSQSLKNKSQSYFVDALKIEDAYQFKLDTSNITPLDDLCVRQLVASLDSSNLDFPAKSSFLKELLNAEKDRKSLLSIQNKSNKTSSHKKRKLS